MVSPLLYLNGHRLVKITDSNLNLPLLSISDPS